MSTGGKIHWAPKLRPERLGRLYQEESRGRLDDALVDDVGLALLLRCRSILHAMRNEVECPRCQTVFSMAGTGDHRPCPAGCGWATTVAGYWQSKRHRDLNVANAHGPIEQFAARYPAARTPRAKLLLIDRLIHEFHWDAKLNVPNRSAANNLLEGSHRQVIEFLDQLSGLEPSAKTEWRQTVAQMWSRRLGK